MYVYFLPFAFDLDLFRFLFFPMLKIGGGNKILGTLSLGEVVKMNADNEPNYIPERMRSAMD